MVHIVAESMDGFTVYPKEALEYVPFVYIHGMLEVKNRYDICHFMKGGVPNKKGIYDVMIHMTDGTMEPGKLYLYDRVKEPVQRFGGLVISNFEDIEVIQAVKKFYDNDGIED